MWTEILKKDAKIFDRSSYLVGPETQLLLPPTT